MSKSVRDVLIEARKLIEKPENWARRYYAYNDFDEQVEPGDHNAVKFCMLGACYNVAGISPHFEPENFERPLKLAIGGMPITYFNDDPKRTHAEVLAAFDRAIAASADR